MSGPKTNNNRNLPIFGIRSSAYFCNIVQYATVYLCAKRAEIVFLWVQVNMNSKAMKQ